MFARLTRRAARPAAPEAAGLVPLSDASGGPARDAAETAARERLRAFALAASDVLLEATPEGRIVFAAGRGGGALAQPEGLVGRDIVSLLAPGDAAGFALALAGAARRGRLAPTVLRFAGGTTATVSAMLVPGPPPRLCFSIGPVALPPATPAAVSANGLPHAAAAMLRDGAKGGLGLVEVTGWPAIRQRLPAAAQAELRDALAGMLDAAVPGARANELADGRYGILAPVEVAMGPVLARIEQFLAGTPARHMASVSGIGMSLAADGLPQGTAARVLRYAIARFTDGGTAAVAAIGAGGGLAAILAQAEARSVAMQAALSGHRFRLAYQPVVSLADRRVHHYEALLRPIETPGLRMDGTQEFVTFAEAVGLSEVLDFAVLEEAVAGLADAPAASVAVNVSGLSLQSAAFCARMFAALEAAAGRIGKPGAGGAEGLRLMVELTETSEIEDMAAAAAALARLREMGVGVCLDDFGMGAAAFRYLQQFHVDFVKIDGSFVHAAMAGGRERGLVAAMVDLATAAGAQTVAEMIETEAQASLMLELGVRQGQGWLFGKPGALPGGRR